MRKRLVECCQKTTPQSPLVAEGKLIVATGVSLVCVTVTSKRDAKPTITTRPDRPHGKNKSTLMPLTPRDLGQKQQGKKGMDLGLPTNEPAEKREKGKQGTPTKKHFQPRK